jgi:ribosomal 50S subunit-associated protein YjgA (DUF615 family)
VPFGTYTPNLQVSLVIDGDRLIINDLFGDRIIAEHTLSVNKGELISNNNHKRDRSTSLDELQNTLLRRLSGLEDAAVLLYRIRRLKPRYARDQFKLIDKTLDTYDTPAIEKALNYCLTHSLYSAVEFRDAAQYFKRRLEQEMEVISQEPNVIVFNSAAAVSKKRPLTEYASSMKGGDK